MNTYFNENPNPNAKIGFVIAYPYQYYPLKNIYLKFKNAAEFIIDQRGCLNQHESEQPFKKTADFLKESGVYFRALPLSKYHPRELETFFSSYRALVGLIYVGCFESKINKNKTKIRIEYGSGKELRKFHPSNANFDLILLQGRKQEELTKFYTSCSVTGSPRFDDWFNDKLDYNFIKKTKDSLIPGKKAILYLPTHGSLSSLDVMTETIISLKNTFNILVKPHHLTVYEEPQKINRLRKNGITVFDDTVDTLNLYNIADVVLGDNSSALFEALLLKKPLVIADFWDQNFFNQHQKEFFYNREIRRPQTYFESIEQRLKREAAICIKKPEELRSAIDKSLELPDIFTNTQKKFVEDTYEFNDGKCADRAKEIMEQFMYQQHPSAKPILHHVFKAYATELKITYIEQIKSLPALKKAIFIIKNLF